MAQNEHLANLCRIRQLRKTHEGLWFLMAEECCLRRVYAFATAYYVHRTFHVDMITVFDT